MFVDARSRLPADHPINAISEQLTFADIQLAQKSDFYLAGLLKNNPPLPPPLTHHKNVQRKLKGTL